MLRSSAWLGLLLVAPIFAQETAPPVEMNAAEKAFQETFNNVTMIGFFTVGDEPATHEDKYVIEKITKVKEDTWKFDARVIYNKKDFKASIPVPVKWAGDTPVLILSNWMIPGQGIYSARILIYNGMYAGTWGAQDHGGKMFGKITKNESKPAESKP